MKEEIIKFNNSHNNIEILNKKDNIIDNNKNKIINSRLNDLSSNLITIILRYSFNYKSILLFRLVNKKMKNIVHNILLEDLIFSKNNNEFFYKFYFMDNKVIQKYFKQNIIKYLNNCDLLYEFISKENENIYNNFLNLFINNYLQDVKEYNREINKNKIIKLSKKIIDKLIINIINRYFIEKNINYLDFSQLIPSKNTFNILCLMIKKIKNFEYLNLNNCITEEQELITDLFDIIEKREEEFTLEIIGVYLNTQNLKILNILIKNNSNKRFIIDKINKGKIEQFQNQKERNKLNKKHKSKYYNN